MDAGWIWFIPCLHDLTMKIWKEWEAHGSWEVMPERNRSSGLLRATPPFRASTVGLHNLQQLYIRGAAKLRRLRNILSAFISPPWASRALPAGSEDVRDNTSSSSSLRPVNRWRTQDFNSTRRLVSELHLRSPRPQFSRCLSSGWTRAPGGRWLLQFSQEKAR